MVALTWIDLAAPQTLSTITDTQNNNYTILTTAATSTNTYKRLASVIAYAYNTKRGADTITVTFSSNTAGERMTLYEFSGIVTASDPLDTQSTAIATSTNPSAGTVMTSTNGEAAVAVSNTDDVLGTDSYGAGSGWTLEGHSGGGSAENADEYQIQSVAGSLTGNFTNVNGKWVAAMATFRTVSGVQVSSRSDTLSDSRLSATSNHTVVFTTNTQITGSSTITLAFPTAFSLPGTLNCGDVDAVTSSQFNFNYPGCAATATAWGFSAVGQVMTLQAPTDSTSTVHVATGTPITIKIGSNATVGQQGAHWITNPSSAGIYTISVGGMFNGSGNMLVSINSGVTVQATVAESLALTASSVNAVNCTADDGATVNSVTSTATSVPFGFISPNTFYQGCQDLIVSTNAGNGYSLTVQESSAMKTANGAFTIPDTTCDGGTCSESAAAAWSTATHNGFGHTCANQLNHDCNAAYSSGTLFRQAADLSQGETAQSVMSSSTAATATGRMKYRLSAGIAQATGIYTTLITYIITGTY